MPIAHKTVISFGLVAIPISMYTATQDNDIHLNQLHKEDNSRIKYRKSCSHCGMDALKASIEQNKVKETPKPKTPRKKIPKGA